MKKYMVIEFIFSGSSNIKKYESDNLDDCRTMKNLLVKQDKEHADNYAIVEIVE